VATAGRGGEVFEGVRALIRRELAEQALPSLAVAVARDGVILWEEGFGWADREGRVPATEHTLYSLASISKPITTTGIVRLVEQENLALDRPINDYLGRAALTARVGDAAEATVRRVADHTSGLPLHYHLLPEDQPYRPPSRAETIRRYGNLVTAPGERWHYSNLGYGVLDHLIARLSGMSYADFLRREVFLPLGMTRASVDVAPGLGPHAAARYAPDGSRLPFYTFDHPGGSAVFCSAHDLLRFGMFHAGTPLADQKAILPDAARRAMQESSVTRDGARGYGLGWGTNADDRGYTTVSHSGGMSGVSTLLTLLPEERVVVVALANAACDLPGRVTAEILAAMLPPYAERKAREESEERRAEEPSPFAPPPALLGEWRGSIDTVEGERPLTLWFREDGDVHARLGDQLRTLLNDVRFDGTWLWGQMTGELETEETRSGRHLLQLDLRPRGDRLTGAAVAHTLPGVRFAKALSHWVELRKG
jgi:CubicO group peptidase (beta-lactamase class C family)